MMHQTVKDKVWEIVNESFGTNFVFEQYWGAKWTLLDMKSPEEFLSEGGDPEVVIGAAQAFCDGAYI
jgi:hypothetical protein